MIGRTSTYFYNKTQAHLYHLPLERWVQKEATLPNKTNLSDKLGLRLMTQSQHDGWLYQTRPNQWVSTKYAYILINAKKIYGIVSRHNTHTYTNIKGENYIKFSRRETH